MRAPLPIFSLIFLCGLSMVWSGPAKVKFDQRQDGDLNVRADLENFVILVIPMSAGTSDASLGLLDLLTKVIPRRPHQKKRVVTAKEPQEVHEHLKEPLEASHDDREGDGDLINSFIESKTAPYHVDISKSKKNLAMLHPIIRDSPNQEQEELLISPNLSLIQQERQERAINFAKGFIVAMQAGDIGKYPKAGDKKE